MNFRLIVLAWWLGIASLGAMSQTQVKDFTLKDVSGDSVSLASVMNGKKVGVVIFTSNHCVYAKKYEDRILALANQYKDRAGMILVNSNDPELSENDSFEAMQARAKEKGYSCPYVQDPDQRVAKAFAAGKNPVAFVLVPTETGSFSVIYAGKIDDNPLMAEAATVFYVKDVLEKILAGTLPPAKVEPETGCHIKGL
jgi:peroxiredoxin